MPHTGHTLLLYRAKAPVCILQVQFSIPSVIVQTSSIQAAAGDLDVTLETRNLTLSAGRATGTPPADPQAPTSQHPLAASSELQVYVVSVTSGGAHAGLGFVNSPSAGSVSMNRASVEVRLNRAVPTSSALGRATATAVVRAHVDFAGVTGQCCPSMLWPVVASLKQLQQQQQVQQQSHQQLLQPGTHVAPPMPAAADTHLSGRGLVPQQGEASTTTTTTLPADDQGSSLGARSKHAAEQAATPAAAPAVAAAVEAAVSVQWELCLQTSSSSHVELVAESGPWLRLSCMQ